MNERRKNRFVTYAIIMFLILALLTSVLNGSVNANANLQNGDIKNDAKSTEGIASAYYDLENLSKLRPHVISEQQSSYDRTGSNADSFWWAMDVNDPDVASAVKRRTLLDVKGSGIVYRIWFAGAGDIKSFQKISVYIDGNTVPVIDATLGEIVRRQDNMYNNMLVYDHDESSGGITLLIPMAFTKSILILGDAIHFYNINYHIFTDGTKLSPYTGSENLSEVNNVFNQLGIDPKDKSKNKTKQDVINLAPKSEKELLNITGTKQIQSIRMKVPDITVEDHYTGKELTDDGRFSQKDDYVFSQFVMQIDPLNEGVVLSRRITVNLSFVHVKVRVDGAEVPGVWKSDVDDQINLWRDVKFEIPSEFTSGKSEITIQIEPVQAASLYMEYYYWCYSKVGGELVLTDELDVGKKTDDGKSKDVSELKHQYIFRSAGAEDIRTVTATYNFLDTEEGRDYNNRVKLAANSLWIEVYYDGNTQPDVQSPIGSFFGFGDYGIDYIRKHKDSQSERKFSNRMQSLSMGIDDDGVLYFYFAMPFEESISIKLINKSDSYTAKNIDYEIAYKNFEGNIRQAGYFKAKYTAFEMGGENAPVEGQPLNVLSESGSGQVVGIVQSIKGPDSRLQLEGDEIIYIDGNKSHSFFGTGTEDFYNGAWYFSYDMNSNATYGVPVHIKDEGYDITVMYRLFTADCITFRNSIKFYMEHGPYNDIMCDESFLVMYYHRPDALLEKTDVLKLGSKASMERHDYKNESADVLSMNADLEGVYYKKDKPFSASGFKVHGQSEFKLKINKSNNGVLLRRLSYAGDQQYQQAKVYVDGVYTGIFGTRTWTDQNIARYDDYIIPMKYTIGKSQIHVKLVNCGTDSDNGIVASAWEGNNYAKSWTEFSYEVFTIKPMNAIAPYKDSFSVKPNEIPDIPDHINGNLNGLHITFIVVGGTVVVGATVTASVILLKKRKKRNSKT